MLTINYVTGDTGNTIDGNSFDRYSIQLDTKQVAIVEYRYEGTSESVTVTGDASLIPNCCGSVHLVASVNMHLIKNLTDEQEFFHEQFFDEDGNYLEKELVILPI